MRCHLLFLPLFAVVGLAAEPRPPVVLPTGLQGYVEQAFGANLALRREQRDTDSSQARVAAARGALQPRVDLAARYTAARGGRTIDLPVGDLLNPVYGTLNTITGAARFPAIENQSIAFLRHEEQETKLRLIQPLYRPEILRGIEAAGAQSAAAQAVLTAYRRDLRLAVIRSYFRWQQARVSRDIYTSAAGLTAEALRVNRALVAAEAATEDAVLRVEADTLLVRQQLLSAEADVALAQAQFNLILDRPSAADIDPVPGDELDRLAMVLRELASAPLLPSGEREELVALDAAVKAADAATRAARASRRPSLSLAVESGIQGSSYRSGAGAGFTQASLVGEWNLFDGRRDASRVRESLNEHAKAELRRDEVRRQLTLQAEDARRRFQVAAASWAAAEGRQAAAARVFSLVTSREREGLVNQLGFLDARHELTAAELNRAAARSQLFISYAELDRSLLLSPLP
jgi:outer membrane protein TolC